MSLQAIEDRIKELTNAIDQSAANHNSLLGRLSEAQHLLSVFAEVAPNVAPAVEVIEAVESAVKASSSKKK